MQVPYIIFILEFEDIMTDKDGFFFPLKKLDSEVIA